MWASSCLSQVWMSRIVLAISERWVADTRVDAIGDFARRLGSSMLVVHIAYGTEGSGADVTPGERTLNQIAERLRGKDGAGPLKVETLFMFSDDLAAAILKTATEQKASLILLGLSSKGMLTRLIEGNVAQEVIRATSLPVLLLPADWASPL
jgi:nucleotide-binding universal stress UspA family protein